MSKLQAVTSNPVIKQYAQGVAASSVQPIANFLAPVVPVPTQVGRFKKYTPESRFRLPDTARALGGPATQLRFEVKDGSYQCQPQALDAPIDNLEKLEAAELEDAVKDAAVSVAEIAALCHEKKVIDLATGAVAATSKTWNSSADPVKDLDDAIRSVLLNATYGSAMDVGVLFGVDAWLIFKNQAKVRELLPVGAKANGIAVPDENIASAMLLGGPKCRVSFMAYDASPEGKQANPSFILGSDIFIFARKDNPTRRDPSFMKTFRLRNQYMVPGSYQKEDGRGEVAKFDWSEDPQIVNASACVRLTVGTV